jgi:hypothetical protein
MQQRTVVLDCLEHLYAIRTPGAIIDLPYVWRRHDFSNESSKNNKE